MYHLLSVTSSNIVVRSVHSYKLLSPADRRIIWLIDKYSAVRYCFSLPVLSLTPGTAAMTLRTQCEEPYPVLRNISHLFHEVITDLRKLWDLSSPFVWSSRALRTCSSKNARFENGMITKAANHFTAFLHLWLLHCVQNLNQQLLNAASSLAALMRTW